MHKPSLPTERCRQGRWAALLLCAAVAAVTSPAQAKDGDTVPLNDAFKAEQEAPKLLRWSDASPLKGLRRVAIGSFQVEFVRKGAASASSTSFGQSGRANTNVTVTLTGVEDSHLQALTEELYREFDSALKVAGFEVLPQAGLATSAAYQKIASAGKPSPVQTRAHATWSSVFAPAGMMVFGEGSTSGGSVVPGLAVFSTLNSMSATMGTAFGSIDASKELGAAVLQARVVVNFVELQSSDRSWFTRTSGTASVEQRYALSITTASALSVARYEAGPGAPQGSVRLALAAPLALDGAPFKEIKDVSSVAANVGLAVLNLAIGKGGSSLAVEKEAVADEAAFRASVLTGIGQLRAMWVLQLRNAVGS